MDLLFEEYKLPFEPHCFWSGRKAREKSYKQKDYLCDNNVPSIADLFEKGKKLVDLKLKKEFFFAVSRFFAFHSSLALVYISSDKKTEHCGFTVGTNFWEAELPVLWKLKHTGKLDSKKITLVLLDDENSEKHKTLCQKDFFDIPIYRRYAHPMDSAQTHSSFVQDYYQQKDYDLWRTEKPRKGILFQSLLHWFNHWKRKTFHNVHKLNK